MLAYSFNNLCANDLYIKFSTSEIKLINTTAYNHFLQDVSRVLQTQQMPSEPLISPPLNCSSSPRIPYLKECLRCTSLGHIPILPSPSLPPISNPCQVFSLKFLESSCFMLPPLLTRESKLSWEPITSLSLGQRCPCNLSCPAPVILFHILGQKWSFQGTN